METTVWNNSPHHNTSNCMHKYTNGSIFFSFIFYYWVNFPHKFWIIMHVSLHLSWIVNSKLLHFIGHNLMYNNNSKCACKNQFASNARDPCCVGSMTNKLLASTCGGKSYLSINLKEQWEDVIKMVNKSSNILYGHMIN